MPTSSWTPASKIIVIIVSIVLALALALAAYYLRPRPKAPSTSAQTAQSALDTLSASTSVVVPSANPLKQAAPAKNPVEATNPFTHAYKNPFQ